MTPGKQTEPASQVGTITKTSGLDYARTSRMSPPQGEADKRQPSTPNDGKGSK